jgi:hypothetical protein
MLARGRLLEGNLKNSWGFAGGWGFVIARDLDRFGD